VSSTAQSFMDRSGKGGVVISMLKDELRSYSSFRVWLLFEAEETVIRVERGSLKCGEWIFVSLSKDSSGCNRFTKIDPLLPTEVLEDDTVQVRTTAVFDAPNRKKPIRHGGFIVHSRYFGQVAAFVSFDDTIPGVPYEVFVERIPTNVTDMALSWFIPRQTVSHGSCVPYMRGSTQFGALFGVVVSRSANSAFIWTPSLGEGVCSIGEDLVNGEWVKFFIQTHSQHEKNPNPNIHFRVATWERTEAILPSVKCRNSVELTSKVIVGDIVHNLNDVMFAEWVGPIEDRRGLLRRKVEAMGLDRYGDKIEVVLERLKKSPQEPLTIWSVKDIPKVAAKMLPSTSDTNTESFFTSASGNSNAYDGFNNDDEDEYDRSSFFNEISRRDHNWDCEDEVRSCEDRFEKPSGSTTFNTTARQMYRANSPHMMNRERSSAATSGSVKSGEGAEEEEAKLIEVTRLLGNFFQSADVREAIKRNCPVDYLQLCQYYCYNP
uniref:SAP domain-containing protein n=1 Tax=Parascaris univalens TaxID=6257 RepID=A0A915C5D4_PARUN